MNVLIVEDELMARRALAATLKRLYPEMTIVGETGSVADTVEWLDNPDHKADLIFMDVELSDGNSFEIFRRTKVNAQVIMTTAYDNYAVKAFEVDSTDYLMKPVSPEDLKRAVERAMSRSSNIVSVNDGTEAGPLKDAVKGKRERFLIKLNDMLLPVKAEDIAYLYAEDKCTYMVTSDTRKFVIDFSLDIAMEQLDDRRFFRISRNCIISMPAISSIVKIGGRYMISAEPEPQFTMMVSRSKTEDFIRWLEGA